MTANARCALLTPAPNRVPCCRLANHAPSASGPRLPSIGLARRNRNRRSEKSNSPAILADFYFTSLLVQRRYTFVTKPGPALAETIGLPDHVASEAVHGGRTRGARSKRTARFASRRAFAKRDDASLDLRQQSLCSAKMAFGGGGCSAVVEHPRV